VTLFEALIELLVSRVAARVVGECKSDHEEEGKDGHEEEGRSDHRENSETDQKEKGRSRDRETDQLVVLEVSRRQSRSDQEKVEQG
jgi:hypothetical protein